MLYDEIKRDKPSIFFLTGLPKSGTTWMMHMLNEINGVKCLGEGRFFSSGLANVPSLRKAMNESLAEWFYYIARRKGNWLNLDSEIITINRQNFVHDEIMKRKLNRNLDRAMRLLVTDLMMRHQACNGLSLIGDKTPLMSADELNNLQNAFPDARIVFMRRNVKDFIVSFLFHFWRSMRDNRPDRFIEELSIDDYLMVESYMNREGTEKLPFVAEDTAMRLCGIWKKVNNLALESAKENRDNFIIITYEDLVDNTLECMRKVLSFLGILVPEVPLRQVIDKHSREAVNRSDNEALKAHIRCGEKNDWMNYMSKNLSNKIDDFITKLP